MRDHREIVRRFAGFSDRTATKAIGQQIQRLVSYKVAGLPPDPQMTRWIEQIPTKLSKRLIEVGLLDASRSEVNKPVLDHLADFEKVMSRQCNKHHAKQTISMIRCIIEACKFQYWSDVKADDIEVYLTQKDISPMTAKYYATAFKHFGYWMVENKRANEAPKIRLSKAKKNYRPAFEMDEFMKILEATIDGPGRYGLSGYERYMLYTIAVETGLRRAELLSLTPISFNPKDRTLFVKGEEHTKHPEDFTRTISEATAAKMKDFVSNKMPTVKLFPIKAAKWSSQMLHEDCKAAGVNIYNAEGKKRVFHSLRHCCGTFLTAKGVHPKLVQSIMRHKDINLTMMRYTHTLRGQEAKAVNSLPDFTVKRATGTN